MLRRMKLDPSTYTYRTYVVSSGDNFSAARAVEFETEWLKQSPKLSFPANLGLFKITLRPRCPS